MQCIQNYAVLLNGILEEKRKDVAYFKDQMFNKYEDVYQDTLDYMAECLEEIKTPPAGRTPFSRPAEYPARVNLPHLFLCRICRRLSPHSVEITTSGKVSADRFTSLIISNKDLTAFARMHFLASSLTGRTLESIKTIPITADNFDIAWKTLVSRYENKRRLIELHVCAFYNLLNVSRENVFELNMLRDKANGAIASLKNLLGIYYK